jgi:sensor domain CHASE-containing protein/signal transduction histidine kinase
MNLRSKILLPVGIVLIGLIAGMYHVSNSILLQGFARVEENTMRVNITRAVNAMNQSLENLASKSSDWGMWDDTCQFVADQNEAFVKSNVSPLALRSIQVDGMVLTNRDGKPVLDVILERDNDDDVLASGRLASILTSYPSLTQFSGIDQVHSGFLLTALGPMMVVSRPILNSQGSGEIQGTLLFVKRIDDAIAQSIEKNTRLHTALHRIGEIDLPGDFSDALQIMGSGNQIHVHPTTDRLITAYTTLHDINSRPLMMMRVSSPRLEYQWGQTTIRYLLLSLIAVAVVSAVLVVVLIEKVVLRRLAGLASQVVQIGQSANACARVRVDGADELSVLGGQMNQMLDSLHRAQEEREVLARKLVETSRHAGMAEVATGILHNVGNVLNSVNVSTNLLAEKLRLSKVQNLGKAIELIRDNQARLGDFLSSDERGKQLPAYLARLSEYLSREQESMLGEVHTLTRSIDHIKQIVSAQQSYARITTASAHFDLAGAMEDAIKINSHKLLKSHVLVEKNYTLTRPVYADRHLVMQILINLISNAEHAMLSVPETRRTLRVSVVDSTSDDRALAIVEDSGCGIDSDTITKIFQFGFTTRPEGHGFGLHASANAAKQMRGTLLARSEGKGAGAIFTLELPLQPAEVNT